LAALVSRHFFDEMFARRCKIDPDWEAGVKSYQITAPFMPVSNKSGAQQMLFLNHPAASFLG
jgi:hypothetical protein